MFPQKSNDVDLLSVLRQNAFRHHVGFSIVVFGSWSYDDSTPQSDIDLFFIAHEENIQAIENEVVLSRLGFLEDNVIFTNQDTKSLCDQTIDLCQIDKQLLGVRADIHLTTIELIRRGFLETELRTRFWNKFKQPLSEDQHYILSTYNGNSVTYAAEYHSITANSYIKESPSLIILDNGDVTVGHLLDKLLTSRAIYDCPAVNFKPLIEYDLWSHFVKNYFAYNNSLDQIRKQTQYENILFENVKRLLFRQERFSNEFSFLLKTRFHKAICNLSDENNSVA